MDVVTYDPYKFSLQTKTIAQQSYDSAISKAKRLVEEKTSLMVHRISRKICNEAFDTFKRNIETAFGKATVFL